MHKLLLTGASSGVGRSLVNHLCKEFYLITISRRIEELINDGNAGDVFSADLSNLDDIEECLQKIREKYT